MQYLTHGEEATLKKLRDAGCNKLLFRPVSEVTKYYLNNLHKKRILDYKVRDGIMVRMMCSWACVDSLQSAATGMENLILVKIGLPCAMPF